jgi:hypothetical protein
MTIRRTTIKRKRPRYPSAAQERARREWAAQFNDCFVCRRVLGTVTWLPPAFERLETHEIGSRAQASGKWADPRNYLRVCETCHREILSWLDESVQCAFKRLHDPANYDRSFINEIRGRADTAITEAEVRNWERFIKAIRG